MSPVGSYRRWARQFPHESRWLPWVWGISALFLLGVGWSLVGQWRGMRLEGAEPTFFPPPQAASAVTQARAKLLAGNWGPADTDAADLASAAALAAERRNVELERGLWGQALAGCGQSAPRLAALKAFALALNLKAEADRTDAYYRAGAAGS